MWRRHFGLWQTFNLMIMIDVKLSDHLVVHVVETFHLKPKMWISGSSARNFMAIRLIVEIIQSGPKCWTNHQHLCPHSFWLYYLLKCPPYSLVLLFIFCLLFYLRAPKWRTKRKSVCVFARVCVCVCVCSCVVINHSMETSSSYCLSPLTSSPDQS